MWPMMLMATRTPQANKIPILRLGIVAGIVATGNERPKHYMPRTVLLPRRTLDLLLEASSPALLLIRATSHVNCIISTLDASADAQLGAPPRTNKTV